MRERASSLLALWRIGRRYLLGRPWQTGLMVLGIVLGVSVGVAVDLANVSASRAFELSTDALVGRATHQIVSGPTGVDEALFPALRFALPDVPVSPVLNAHVTSPELGGLPLQLLGLDPLREAPFRDYLGTSGNPVRLAEFLTRPGALFISRELGQQNAIGPGSPISISVAGVSRAAYVADLIAPPGDLGRRAVNGTVLADVSTAQELLNRPGRLDHIDLILPAGDSTVAQHIRSMLPAGTRLEALETRAGAVEQMTAAFRTNLSALSLLALVVGMFLIYNTMTFSVVKRRPLFGALRSLGVTRREVFALVLIEAGFVGAVGSIFGLFLGILLGQGAVRAVSQTINDLYFVTTVRDVSLPIQTMVKAFVLGTGATLLSTLPAAWEATTSPVSAVLQRSTLESGSWRQAGRLAWAGLASIAAGGLVLAAPTRDLTVSFGGTFAVIIGCALLTPGATLALVRIAGGSLGRMAGPVGRIAAREVARSLSRTGVALAALMIAVAVTIGVSLMVGSFRETVIAWLEQTLRGDVYITTFGQPATQTADPINPRVLDIIQGWPEVRRVDTLRAVTVDSPRGPIHITAIGNPDFGRERIFLWASERDVWQGMQEGAVTVSEPLANRLGVAPGKAAVTLYADSGPHSFPVIGVYYDYTSSEGSVSIADAVYRGLWNDQTVTAVGLRLTDGRNADETARALEGQINGVQQLSVRPTAVLRRDALMVFDRTFAITSALQFLAVLVAFVGVLSALLSLQLDRQRDVGVLRAIGLTGRQLWGLMMLETGLIGVVAGLLAMPTGLTLSFILIYIINKRSFGWTLQLDLAGLPFVEALFIALVAALLAGVYPARRLSGIEPIEALRFE